MILRIKSEQNKKEFSSASLRRHSITSYCKRITKKAESDAATMETTTGKATVAEEVPGAGAGDSMVAEVAELINTAETKRATKNLLTLFISIIFFGLLFGCLFCVFFR